MKELFTLLEKFHAGAATLEEQQQLLHMLSSHEQEVGHILSDEYNNNLKAGNETILSKEQSDVLLMQILAKTQIPSNDSEATTKAKIIRTSFKWVQWVAAASVLMVISLSVFYANRTNQKPIASTITKPTLTPTLQQLTNTTTQPQVYHLPDGSTVTLSPKSAIAYYQPFVKTRDISLTGEATFKVAKDAAKPFSVYANNMVTTALGTTFTVTGTPQSVKVVLIEGRVVVRSADAAFAMNNTYLQPGEQLVINKQAGTYALGNTVSNKTNSKAALPVINNKSTNLVFNKTPLTEVITSIGNRYNVLVQYDKDVVKNLSFTGTFTPTDSLQTILTIICNTNDLSFKLDKGMVIISKQ